MASRRDPEDIPDDESDESKGRRTSVTASFMSYFSWSATPPTDSACFDLSPEEAQLKSDQDLRKQKIRESRQTARKKPTKLQQLREGYESLVCAVVRPPRSRYDPAQDLGPVSLRLDSGAEMERRDFVLPNHQGFALQCSIWLPSGGGEVKEGVRTAVVYLHGNSSCRVDATRTGVLETVGPLGAALVAFDFAGSGLSDGDYVTLGWHEQHDVATVVRHLLGDRGFDKVALWGRSMGAVSALLFAQSPEFSDARPSMLVLDSPFASFPRLVDDLIKKGAIRVPKFAIKTVLSMVRNSVKKRTGADIYKLEPILGCGTCSMPALFITADRDEMIPCEHGSSLDTSWGGQSLQVVFRGGHNSPRPPHIYDSAGTFLRSVLNFDGEGAAEGKGDGAGTGEALEASVRDGFSSIKDLCRKTGKGGQGGGAGDLPPGWLSASDPETGDTYYYDTFSHKTTWFKPHKPSEGWKGDPSEGGGAKQRVGGDGASAQSKGHGNRTPSLPAAASSLGVVTGGVGSGGIANRSGAGVPSAVGCAAANSGSGGGGGGGSASRDQGEFGAFGGFGSSSCGARPGELLPSTSEEASEEEANDHTLTAKDLAELINYAEAIDHPGGEEGESGDGSAAGNGKASTDTNDAAGIDLALF